MVGIDSRDGEGSLDGPLGALGFAEIQEPLLWSEKFGADVAMMKRGVVLRHVVGQVECARAPVES